ncbi:hypothetical protein ACS0TY_035083 [Phlomoides rotata]
MNRDTFNHFCYLLRHSGGLVDGRYVSVGEQVAIFLIVLSHHSKVRVVNVFFKRSSHTVHQHFHNVLTAILNLHGILLASPTPVDDECTHPRWKHFKGCLGALDDTLIDVTIPEINKARYRTRKGTISVNVLAFCDRSMRVVYMLTSWEGLVVDDRALRDVCRNDGFSVPHEFENWLRGLPELDDATNSSIKIGLLGPHRNSLFLATTFGSMLSTSFRLETFFNSSQRSSP